MFAMMVGWLVDRMIGWLVVRIVCHKCGSHKRGSCCVFLPYLFSWYPAGLIKYVLLMSELIVTAMAASGEQRVSLLW